MGFRGKRGSMSQEALKRIAYLVLIAVSAVVFAMYIDSFVSDTTFYKNYYAKDSSLLIDSIQSLPGDVWFLYGVKRDVAGVLDFEFTRGEVNVNRVNFFFGIENQTNYFDGGTNITDVNELKFTKEENNLLVEEVSYG